MPEPTQTFEEAIELIRVADSPETVGELTKEIKLDQYCYFHSRLIFEALRQRLLYFKEISFT